MKYREKMKRIIEKRTETNQIRTINKNEKGEGTSKERKGGRGRNDRTRIVTAPLMNGILRWQSDAILRHLIGI